ncbi:glycosyltransferase [Agrococcus sp. HG114]|uniref:glycosyltransferase n=1 Tax=Agrococcus sp. HG114 TaxID=2969757 RepID=UPI00215B3506|nr:glycosyltransferase [Agrococcus sp. HG114]MCR8669942.1 glycosyltransferase [Agrococcus sp. HG114]
MTSFGIVSTYPPTRCGIATFAESLATALVGVERSGASIVRVLDAPEPRPERSATPRIRIVGDLVAGDVASVGRAARALAACDVAIVQHEYGIYGGTDGDEVLRLLEALRVPSVVVLHTVLRSPTASQRAVLERVCALADAVVVMTAAARDVLASGYAVQQEKVTVIPHGIAPWTSASAPRPRDGTRVLTWGLIGPGKGLEWGIRAIADVRRSIPDAEYRILGQTHPKVLAHEGERYRERLVALVDELGLHEAVSLEAEYATGPRLAAAVAAADAVLLPYESRVQVTSGVLVEALAAGAPVVATAFPHALELLGGGAGIVVPHDDPAAIARALTTVLGDRALAERMGAAASRRAGSMSWSNVAARYRRLADRVLDARAA